jgi:cytochrome oxidase Cu insertion factor (SCO1/SenC/PrrC family)/copper(I)-binding protein
MTKVILENIDKIFSMKSKLKQSVKRSLVAFAVLWLGNGSAWAEEDEYISKTKEKTPWGRDYFPNLPLIDQNGKKINFFDEIEGKIVVINFVYTGCLDTCPLETAQLVRVQELLGDRMGKDIFFYSITLDPETDTPAVLKEYSKKFHAKWTFLTGKEEDVFEIQRKLGLFLDEIKDGLENHNVNMIIGNQATGQWMKRSPFENPHILADQLGNWLDGWKRPPEIDEYKNAPKLRDLSRGEQIFRTRCYSCHTVTGMQRKAALGPDLLGVIGKRNMNWLVNWLRAPDQMLEDKDPIAIALFEEYNKLAMPNLRLNKEEVTDVIDFLQKETERVLAEQAKDAPQKLVRNSPSNPATTALTKTPRPDDVIAVMNSWIREAHPAAKGNSGYVTLVNGGSENVTLVGVESDVFESVEISEMAKVNGSMRRRSLSTLVVPAEGRVEFKPGQLHLLLKQRKKNLPAGEKVDLIFTFRSGSRQTVTVSVINL